MIKNHDHQPRRLARVDVAPELLAEMVHKGWKVPTDDCDRIECVEGVPPDARYIRVAYSPDRDVFGLVFEHESFAEVKGGAPIPLFEPTPSLMKVRHDGSL